ncbi:DNRLRE domain-containing protein, partial [Aquisphaera insulae]|uniref:DNRLRE domain-containing protein n=1 Tax=Aquisphaera insulae TaxID=2712864 RepID=UPI0013ECB39A
MSSRSSLARLAVVTLLASFLLAVARTRADLISLDPIADTRIFTNAPDVNDGSDIQIGVYSNQTGINSIQRTLMQFDLSAIPQGSIVISAHLTLYTYLIFNDHYNVFGKPMEIYRLTTAWSEYEATWNRPNADGPLWNGGDYAGTTNQPDVAPYSTNSSSGALTGMPITWNITSLVQDWVSSTVPNFGLLLRSYEGNYQEFASREFSNAQLRDYP